MAPEPCGARGRPGRPDSGREFSARTGAGPAVGPKRWLWHCWRQAGPNLNHRVGLLAVHRLAGPTGSLGAQGPHGFFSEDLGSRILAQGTLTAQRHRVLDGGGYQHGTLCHGHSCPRVSSARGQRRSPSPRQASNQCAAGL